MQLEEGESLIEENGAEIEKSEPFLVPSYFGKTLVSYFPLPPEADKMREVDVCKTDYLISVIPVSNRIKKVLKMKEHWNRQCVYRNIQRSGYSSTLENNFLVYFGKHFSDYDLYAKLKPYQKVNHFPNSFSIGRKDRLSRLLFSFSRNFKEYDFHPMSFILPSESRSLISYISRNSKKLLIKKPPASACGRGIKVCRANEVMRSIDKESNCIFQQYISNPLLIHGYKFDLRIYVLVTSFDPLVAYVYEDGLVRLATEQYNKKSVKNKYSHLTNSSINEKNPKYYLNNDGEGSKLTFSDLQKIFINVCSCD